MVAESDCFLYLLLFAFRSQQVVDRKRTLRFLKATRVSRRISTKRQGFLRKLSKILIIIIKTNTISCPNMVKEAKTVPEGGFSFVFKDSTGKMQNESIILRKNPNFRTVRSYHRFKVKRNVILIQFLLLLLLFYFPVSFSSQS